MKKILSMALTLAMSASLFAVSAPTASAKEFGDDSDITYKEAADVISAIEVMDGYTDGTFRPDGDLTRGAASKIICNLILGPTTASALPTSVNPFPDVPSGHTFAGYIAYCSEQGIISGYGDGTFRPSDPLTGYAFTKMLLGALGYDSEIEHFTGDNWKVNVAKLAINIGLDDDLVDANGNEIELQGSEYVNREEAALYALNTLKADMVEYDEKITASVGGAEITIGNSKARSRTWQSQATEVRNIRRDGIVQFAEEYFPRLQMTDVDGDDFGRPATRWDWKGVEVGTYAETPDYVFHSNPKINEIYSELGMSSKDEEAQLFFNGREDPNSGHIEVSRSVSKDLSAVGSQGFTWHWEGNDKVDDIGDGTIVEVFRDDDNNHVTICVIAVYGGKVTAVKDATTKKDACVSIEWNVDEHPAGIGTSDHNEFETTDFEEDDIVAYTYSESANEIKDMYKLKGIEGSLTRRTIGKSVTLGSAVYKYAQDVAFDCQGGEDNMSNKSDYVVYLDNQGYALWIEDAEFAADVYALIDRISIEAPNAENGIAGSSLDRQTSTSLWDSNRVRLLKANGTKITVNLDESKKYRNEAGNGLAPDFLAGQVVRFSQNSDGDYRLHAVTEAEFQANASNALNGSTTVHYAVYNKGIAGFYSSNGRQITADSKTVFVVNDDDTYKTYTGVRNAPDVYGTDVYAVAYYKNNVAKVIFVTDGTVSSSSKDVTFIAGPSASKLVTADDTTRQYYEYQAVVKGNVETIRVEGQEGRSVTPFVNTENWDGIRGHTVTSDGDIRTLSTNWVAGSDNEWDGLILNRTTYDSDDILYRGGFDSRNNDLGSYLVRGIKKVSGNDEVELDTYKVNGQDSSITLSLASTLAVYYINEDGDIEKTTLSAIKSDSDDFVYYTTDDGEVTNLFIQEWSDDDDDDDRPDAPFAEKANATKNINLQWNTSANTTLDLVSGGTAPYRYSLAGGSSLPAGLELSSTGVITGIPTSTGTTYTDVLVTDNTGTSVRITITIRVFEPLAQDTNAAAALSLTNANVGDQVNMNVASVVTGGVPDYTYAVRANNTLPSYLTLDTATGVITGTIPETATDASFDIQVTDALGQTTYVTISIAIANPEPLAPSDTTVTIEGTVGRQIEDVVVSEGVKDGTAPYTFALAEGSVIPDGLLLNEETGVIGGTPAEATDASFSVTVTDATGATVDVEITVNITEAEAES